MPIATVIIVDEDRIWFNVRAGLAAAQLPREPGLCASAILLNEPYVVNDALTDPRTVRYSLINGEPGIRFYAVAPIVTADGYRLGTVNAIDTRTREMTEPPDGVRLAAEQKCGCSVSGSSSSSASSPNSKRLATRSPCRRQPRRARMGFRLVGDVDGGVAWTPSALSAQAAGIS